MDLGCTGRKGGQTDSTRTREKEERQTEPSCRAPLAGSRKTHSEHAQSAHTGGCYEGARKIEGQPVYYGLLTL